MNDEQYWAWFWKNVTVWLPITLPVFIGLLVWMMIQWWNECHEDDPPKEHFTKLFRR